MKVKHGMYGTSIYKTWIAMKQRCINKKDSAFHNYGGRGITVSDSWKYNFQQFFDDMGERPLGYSLDRIDNNGNYEPGNCRWATRKEQQNNTRRNILCFIDNREVSIEYFSIFCGLSKRTIRGMIRDGMSCEEIIKYSKKYHERKQEIKKEKSLLK